MFNIVIKKYIKKPVSSKTFLFKSDQELTLYTVWKISARNSFRSFLGI